MAFNDKRISALSQLPLAAAVKVEVTEGNVAIKIKAEKKLEAAGKGKGSEAKSEGRSESKSEDKSK
jgi:hypothetical protein